jgi:hypothetical protein
MKLAGARKRLHDNMTGRPKSLTKIYFFVEGSNFCNCLFFFSKTKKKKKVNFKNGFFRIFFVENLSLALSHLHAKFQSNPPSHLGGDSGLSSDRQTDGQTGFVSVQQGLFVFLPKV